MGRKFMLTLTIGLTAMSIGFIARIALHYKPTTLGVFVVAQLVILLSPCAFLAADYVIFREITTFVGDDIS